MIAAAGFRVLRPQPRGIGASSGPTEGITLIDLAADVVAAIEADCAPEKPEALFVVGHAFGNWVARVLAHHWPSMTKICRTSRSDYRQYDIARTPDFCECRIRQFQARTQIAYFIWSATSLQGTMLPYG
ncbi:alpha/beta fold hydrolase [Rhizobium beringeri]